MNPLPTGPRSIRSITTINTIADIFIFCKSNRKTRRRYYSEGYACGYIVADLDNYCNYRRYYVWGKYLVMFVCPAWIRTKNDK